MYAYKKIMDGEKLFDSLIEIVDDIYWVYDLNIMRVVYCSKPDLFEEVTGANVKDVHPGMKLNSEAKKITSDILDYYKKVIRDRTNLTTKWYIIKSTADDGAVIRIRARGKCLVDTEGEAEFVVGVMESKKTTHLEEEELSNWKALAQGLLFQRLNDEQKRYASLLISGKSRGEIAEQLKVSPDEVSGMQSNIKKKVGIFFDDIIDLIARGEG